LENLTRKPQNILENVGVEKKMFRCRLVIHHLIHVSSFVIVFRALDWLGLPSKASRYPEPSAQHNRKPIAYHIIHPRYLSRILQEYLNLQPSRRHTMAEATAPKPSSSVKLVLLGEAAVGKVWITYTEWQNDGLMGYSHL
jgi:hypothetical protein